MGVTAVINFRIYECGLPSKRIQIIVCKRYPASHDMTWGEFVTSSFDIDICKMYIVPGSPYQVPSRVLLSPNIRDGIANQRFWMVMFPYKKYEVIFRHLLKYKKRGFELESLMFRMEREESPAHEEGYQIWKQCTATCACAHMPMASQHAQSVHLSYS